MEMQTLKKNILKAVRQNFYVNDSQAEIITSYIVLNYDFDDVFNMSEMVEIIDCAMIECL